MSSMTTLTRGGASGDGPVFPMEFFVFSYKIFGALAGDAGLLFHSCVPNLQDKPDLWADECPYIIPRNGRVEVKLVYPSDQVPGNKVQTEVAEEASC